MTEDLQGGARCPLCQKVLVAMYEDAGRVTYEHSDFEARAFTEPCYSNEWLEPLPPSAEYLAEDWEAYCRAKNLT